LLTFLLMAAVPISPKRRAENLGAIMTAQGLGAIIGMPIGSVLYENCSTLVLIWPLFAVQVRLLHWM
jgi:hypothetical protein